MNSIFFFIPFLIIASLGIYQDVFAAENTTIIGQNYFDTDNGDGTRTWSTHEPYILDNGVWVPFVNSGLTTQNHFATVTLNTDGSYTFAGKFTDKIIAKYADVSNLNSWTYLNSLNNDTPDNNWDGIGFVSTKINSVGKLEYKYILNNGKWKTQLEATNLSALNTKAFGFDQIIDLNSDTIKFNGITRNLDNFNGTTFNKQFLIDNKGKVLDLLNGINFDFDLGFDNLYSITVYDTGVNKSRLVFDYRTSVPLLPNETLIIDPTFGYTASSAEVRIQSPSATGAACSTTGTYSVYGGAEIAFVPRSGDNAFCTRMTLEWDTTSIPDTATVTNVNFRYDVTGTPYSTRNCDFTGMSVAQPSTSGSPLDLWNNIGNSTVYVDNSVTCTTVANDKVLDLGASADSDLQAKLAVNWFAVGIKLDSEVRDAGVDYGQVESGGTWDLEVTYTDTPAPDSITDLTADTVGSTTASLSFTPPNLNGETLINYMLNVTTPQASPVTTFWMNGSASPFSVTGLSIGTDYSASASAYTAGGGNWTLANVLNFTTALPTISCCAPTSLVASSNSATQIDLQWVASSLQNLNGYRIERETPIGTGFNVVTANTSNTNIFYNNTGLSTNIIYNYRVYGLNGSGQSLASNTYDMTTFHLPDAVTTLTGTTTDLSTIDLSWTAPTSYAPEILGYMINGTTPTGEPVDILNSNTGTTATTATALNLLIGQEYSFRVSQITVHGLNATGNIWNGSTIQTFVIGNLSNPDVTNDDDFSIFFDRTDLNSSAIQLDVTYPNSYNLSCDFAFKYARTNQTYSGLTTVPNGTDNQVATFTLINATGDLVQVHCWDPATGDESTYVITITDFPFLEQVRSLRNGDYGTFFQIGAFDGVMLIVIFLGMIGLNRTTPIVGIVFVVITTLVMSYFELITYPIIMYPALIMMIVWAFVTTRKDD